MSSFKNDSVNLPTSSVWLMNAISEFKGKQELYVKQSPQILRSLIEMALIESAESSNRIEGVTVDRNRLKPLVIGHSKPRDRSEEEVAGYRKALDFIHTKYSSLIINPDSIKELHRLSHGESGDAGKWKGKDNDIIRKHNNGTVEVIFKPVRAIDTPKAVNQLCLAYEHSVSQLKYPPLYAVACLILDFLCIHPFRDGNGRVSRLLTLLALYHHNFGVGKYISLERIVEQSKETYYESLNKSSQEWYQGKHNILSWLNYFLGTILSAYKEFEQRAGTVKPGRGAKTLMIESAIEKQIGEFSISDIERECPSVGRDMIRIILNRSRREDKIICKGTGRGAVWSKRGNN